MNEYDATYFHHQLSSTIFPPRNADDICAASEIGSDLAKLWQHATENSGDGGNPKILKMIFKILRKHCQRRYGYRQPRLNPHDIFHNKQSLLSSQIHWSQTMEIPREKNPVGFFRSAGLAGLAW